MIVGDKRMENLISEIVGTFDFPWSTELRAGISVADHGYLVIMTRCSDHIYIQYRMYKTHSQLFSWVFVSFHEIRVIPLRSDNVFGSSLSYSSCYLNFGCKTDPMMLWIPVVKKVLCRWWSHGKDCVHCPIETSFWRVTAMLYCLMTIWTNWWTHCITAISARLEFPYSSSGVSCLKNSTITSLIHPVMS